MFSVNIGAIRPKTKFAGSFPSIYWPNPTVILDRDTDTKTKCPLSSISLSINATNCSLMQLLESYNKYFDIFVFYKRFKYVEQ